MSDVNENAQAQENAEVDAEQIARKDLITQQMKANTPVYIPNPVVVDAVALMRAQGRYIKAQTRWLLQRNQFGTPEFLDELGMYSRAQTEIIDAFQLALHQAEVL